MMTVSWKNGQYILVNFGGMLMAIQKQFNKLLGRLVAFVCLGGLFVSCAQEIKSADMVLYNARIYTVNKEQPWVQALAIRDGKIIYVGNNQEVKLYIEKDTEAIDLKGLMVMPGFQDAHLHVIEGGMSENICILPEEASFEKYERLIKLCARDWKDGDWVLGAGVYAGGLIDRIKEEGELPIDVLDRAVPNKSVLILDSVGHGAWVNSKALKMVGYDRLRDQPQGGLIHRDLATGRLSGVVFENAYQKLQDAAWEPKGWKVKETERGLTAGLKALAQNGVTSVSDAGGYWPRGHDDVWQRFEKSGRLTVRASNALYVYPDVPFEKQLRELRRRYSNQTKSKLRFKQAKIYVDGIMSYGTSALYKPYTDLPPGPLAAPLGYLYFEPERLKRYAAELDKMGFQLHFHATGDRAVGLALDAIEWAQKKNRTSDRRHRITHLYQVAKKDLPRFQKLGVIADLQIDDSNQDPEYLADMGDFIGNRVNRLLPLADLLKANAQVTLSSDWDAASLSPFESLQKALTRQRQAAPDLATAIQMKTLNTAYLLHQEQSTGSLEVGKWADLVVLNQDLFKVKTNKIKKTRVLLTMLGGKVVYEAKDF